MCGRYTLTSTEGLQLRFELVEGSGTRLSPRRRRRVAPGAVGPPEPAADPSTPA